MACCGQHKDINWVSLSFGTLLPHFTFHICVREANGPLILMTIRWSHKIWIICPMDTNFKEANPVKSFAIWIAHFLICFICKMWKRFFDTSQVHAGMGMSIITTFIGNIDGEGNELVFVFEDMFYRQKPKECYSIFGWVGPSGPGIVMSCLLSHYAYKFHNLSALHKKRILLSITDPKPYKFIDFHLQIQQRAEKASQHLPVPFRSNAYYLPNWFNFL